MTRSTVMLLAALAAVASTSALAAGPKRVLVAGSAASVALVEAALGKSATVIKQAVLPEELSASALVDMARASQVTAVVSAHSGATEDLIDVFNGADGATLAHLVVKHSKKSALKVLPKQPTAQLLKAIAVSKAPKGAPRPAPPAPKEPDPARAPVASPAPSPSPSPSPTTSSPAASTTASQPTASTTVSSTAETSSSSSAAETPVVRVALGVRTFQRALSWRDDVLQQLPAYQLPFGPAAAFDAEFYPLALVTHSAVARLGIVGGFEQAIGLVSSDAEKERYETNSMRFRVGAQFSVPVSILTIRATAGWSMQSFGFSSVSTNAVPKVNIPNVRYAALRGGLGLGIRIVGPLSFELGGAYQYVLDSGELSTAAYFSRAKTAGADFTAALTLRILKNVELRLGAEYERYWLTLNPQPGDPWVAGGALDEYRSLNLQVAWVL